MVPSATRRGAGLCFAQRSPRSRCNLSDPCYHAVCDTFSNNSNEVLDLNADAIAFATLTYAMDTSSVNGA